MSNNFICVTDMENLHKTIDNNIWGVKESHKRQLKKVENGDNLLFFVKAGRYQGEKNDSAIFGIYKVASELFFDSSKIFITNNESFPYRIKISRTFNMDSPKNFRTLIPKLKIIKNKKRWGILFMGRAMIQIDNQDYELIKEYLNIDM